MYDAPFPPSLLEFQTWFARIIIPPIKESDSSDIPIYPSALIQEISQRIAPSPTLKSEERLGIYQQQYWWRLLTTMQELFPSLVAIFDYKEFNERIAEPYLVAFPPDDWFLSHIGLQLPTWLDRCYREKNASLLIQLARLDQLYEALIFTEILPAIDFSTLSECEERTLFLQPFVHLFELGSGLFAYRSRLLEEPPSHWQDNPLPELKKNREKRYTVLYRHQEKNVYEEISPSFYTLLSSFQKGAKLADLIPLLEGCEEIVSCFQIMASRSWLTLQGPSSSYPKANSRGKTFRAQKQTREEPQKEN